VVPQDQLSPELRELLAARLEGPGQLAELLLRAAEQPQALGHFVRWRQELEETLPPRLATVVAMSVATEARSEYLLARQEELAPERGLEEEEVRRLVAGQAMSCATLAPEEVAAATLARCLAGEGGRGCEAALLRLRRLVGEPGSVACLMLAASQLGLVAMANAWRLDAAEQPDPGEVSA